MLGCTMLLDKVWYIIDWMNSKNVSESMFENFS